MLRQASPLIVAQRYLQADLSPPLGYPGGACHLIDRIRKSVRSPAVVESLIRDVADGDDLTNPEASQVYGLDAEAPPAKTRFKKILISPHAQYRMDLRGITVPEIRLALKSFNKAFLDAKSRNDPTYRRWVTEMAHDTGIVWEYPQTGLTVVFAAGGDGTVAKIITAYWPGHDELDGGRCSRKASVVIPGVRTFVSPKSERDLPTNLDREPDSATTPSTAMPGGGRDIPRFEFNGPDSDSNVQPRSSGLPGDEYGHPTKFDYNMPTRRSMTAAVIRRYLEKTAWEAGLPAPTFQKNQQPQRKLQEHKRYMRNKARKKNMALRRYHQYCVYTRDCLKKRDEYRTDPAKYRRRGISQD